MLRCQLGTKQHCFKSSWRIALSLKKVSIANVPYSEHIRSMHILIFTSGHSLLQLVWSVVLHWHGRQTVYIPSLPWLYSKSHKRDAVYRKYTALFYGRSITVAVWLKESKQNSCPNKKVFQTTTSTSLNNPRSFVSRGRQLTRNRRWGTDGLWPGRRCLLGERYRGLASHPSFFS